MSRVNLTLKAKFPKDFSIAGEMFPKSASAALNRVVRSARTQVSKEIRQTYNIKASDVSDVIEIKPATRTRLTATLSMTGSSLALMMFGARQTAAGVSIMVKRGARKVLKHTFLATMKSGHEGVFERKGKKRLPIQEKFTIGLPQMFNSRRIREKLTTFVNEKLPQELERTIKAFRMMGRE